MGHVRREVRRCQKAATSEWGKISRIGMVATAGDRRDQDLRDLGAAAAKFFDVIVVREDERLRGRKPGESAALVIEGARAAQQAGGARVRQIEEVLDEVAAVRHCVARANPGDIVVLCVDNHARVVSELESITQAAQARADERGGDLDVG
jgi:cyanophycin synthetase